MKPIFIFNNFMENPKAPLFIFRKCPFKFGLCSGIEQRPRLTQKNAAALSRELQEVAGAFPHVLIDSIRDML